jgi:predicted 2-oxoglutarate/Fe(II)-dependent dioxygenase YbiX
MNDMTKMLLLPPTSNHLINTLYVKHKFFNDDHVKEILKEVKNEAWVDSDTVNPDTGQSRKTKQRICQGQNIPNNFPIENLLDVVNQLNSQYWKFNIQGIDVAKDYPFLYKYNVGGHFDWHIDMSAFISTRKLAFSIQLSNSEDYEGGDLQFYDGNNPTSDLQLREKGSLIIFPSFVWHRVTPITKGTRYAIVGWIHGETFK